MANELFTRIKHMAPHFRFNPKLKLKKAYVAFFAVVPLLTLLSVISVPCPVCSGTGSISSIGMGDVVISRIDYSIKSINTIDTCLSYRIYNYDVIMTVQNISKTRTAAGFIKLAIVDYTTNKILATQVTDIQVPPLSEVTKLFTVMFGLSLDSPTTTQIVAEPVYTKLECKSCEGTGKISLNSLPLVNLMKDRITQAQSVSVLPVIPPEPTEISEFDIGQEYNTDQWIQLHPDGETDIQ